MLLELATAADLFHAAGGTAYADLPIDGHRETWPVRSSRFRAWLRRLCYEATAEAVSAAALNSALNLLEARAQFEGPERTVNVRVAEHDGFIYLDLADRDWGAVEIGPEGWQLVAEPPVRFRRPPGMLPLPVPQPGGSIEQLACFLNLPDPSDLILVLSWLLAALRHAGPYPLLVVAGEQGSAKTVLSKMLRALVDPNVAPVRTLPREERDLFIAANNGHVLAFDNLSTLPSWLSDTLCRLASGGAFAVRRLYTDQDEVLFEAARPIILNGIEDAVTRPDLADRALFLTPRPLSEAQRRPEQELWQEFEHERPRLLGALLDAMSHGLKTMPQVRLARLPRMADFAVWAAACETALWSEGTFARTYAANRKTTIDDAIDMLIRSLPAYASSWPRRARGLAPPVTYCGSAPITTVMGVGTIARPGRKIRGHLPAVCGGRRPSCGRSASISPLPGRAVLETDSSECVRKPMRPSGPPADHRVILGDEAAIVPSLLDQTFELSGNNGTANIEVVLIDILATLTMLTGCR
jgi:hypothetical protein